MLLNPVEVKNCLPFSPRMGLFCRQLPLPKTYIFHSNELLSLKVLDLDGCFSSEEPYHDQGDYLMWTGPQ